MLPSPRDSGPRNREERDLFADRNSPNGLPDVGNHPVPSGLGERSAGNVLDARSPSDLERCERMATLTSLQRFLLHEEGPKR